MSINLGEGLNVKSGRGGGVLYPRRGVHVQAPSGDDTYHDMASFVGELGDAFEDPRLRVDPVFQAFLAFLRTYRPKDVGSRNSPSGSVLATDSSFRIPTDYQGPSVDVLGQTLSARQLAVLTDYVIRNSDLDGPEDARVAFLASLEQAQ